MSDDTKAPRSAEATPPDADRWRAERWLNTTIGGVSPASLYANKVSSLAEQFARVRREEQERIRERATPEQTATVAEPLISAVKAAGFRLGPDLQGVATLRCVECGRDSGFHFEKCSKTDRPAPPNEVDERMAAVWVNAARQERDRCVEICREYARVTKGKSKMVAASHCAREILRTSKLPAPSSCPGPSDEAKEKR